MVISWKKNYIPQVLEKVMQMYYIHAVYELYALEFLSLV